MYVVVPLLVAAAWWNTRDIRTEWVRLLAAAIVALGLLLIAWMHVPLAVTMAAWWAAAPSAVYTGDDQ